ncbi:hypothetical protein A9310_21895 [Gordonia sp. UCD-TK1]|nr:hypothetical protein A9310_21895 [Gordonia sp. UCD-TK1]
MRLRTGSLFSGYGGLDLAVNAFYGSETAWHVEYEAAPSKILAHHWPDIPNHGDVTQIDWAAVEPVDILTGGFPCQDVSAAGRRAGLMKGTRTGLFHNTIEAIDALRPSRVVLENVAGLLSADGEPWPDELVELNSELQYLNQTIGLIDNHGHAWGKKYDDHERNSLVRQRKRALDRFNTTRRRSVQRAIGTVVGELAAIGYDAQWTTLSASDVGACHRRERVFILATPADPDGAGSETRRGESRPGEPRRLEFVDGSDSSAADSEGDGRDGWAPDAVGQPVERAATAGCGEGRGRGEALTYLSTPQARDYKGVPSEGFNTANLCRDVRDLGMHWGPYEAAIRRAEAATGRPAPAPTEPNRNGKPRLNAEFASWMMMLPAGWVTNPAIGLSRNDQLKAIGNGVCPPQAHWALTILDNLSSVGVVK